MNLSKHLKDYMERTKVSRAELARLLNLDPVTAKRLIDDPRHDPKFSVISRVQALTKIPWMELLFILTLILSCTKPSHPPKAPEGFYSLEEAIQHNEIEQAYLNQGDDYCIAHNLYQECFGMTKEEYEKESECGPDDFSDSCVHCVDDCLETKP
jgi:hypothetical protein